MSGKPKVKIHDKIFAHAKLMSNGKCHFDIPFEWYRGDDHCKVSIFTDFSLDEVDNCTSEIKIALLMESPGVFPERYRHIQEVNNKFDLVLTFDYDLLLKKENYREYYLGGTWIKSEDQKVYNKTKDISMIASKKQVTEGHKLRHEIYSNFLNIDFFGGIGGEHNKIDYKLEGLKDYHFSIAIENCQKNFYFTEKLLDCFLTGTIPVYYGCPYIGNYFNNDGVVFIDNLVSMQRFFNEGYHRRAYQVLAVEHNFKMAQKYITPEFQIWDYLKKYYD